MLFRSLGTPRRPSGLNTVLLTNSGGEAELVADVSDAAGMPLMMLPDDLAAEIDAAWPFHGVHNPIDYWAFGEPGEIVPDLVMRCARHPEVDIDIFFTHTHLDHITGLTFFQPLFNKRNSVRLWAGHLQGPDTLKQVVSNLMQAPLYPVSLEVFQASVDFS